MGLRAWLQSRRASDALSAPQGKATEAKPATAANAPAEPQSQNSWEPVEPYTALEDSSEATLPSVIATAIAAGDHPKSEFKVTSVKKANPEYRLVSVIATSIAAGDKPQSDFVVKRIYKLKQEEEYAS